MSVSEELLVPSEFLYSQHGNTMCPDGAVSSWKLSVPAGSPDSILMSPGPQKCSFIELKSKIARFFCNAASPNNPGNSESGTDGIVNFPKIDDYPSIGFSATGSLQSK